MGNTNSQNSKAFFLFVGKKKKEQKFVRSKKDKFIKDMLKEQQDLSSRTTIINQKLIFGDSEEVEKKNSLKWHEFSSQCFQSLVNAKLAQLKLKQQTHKNLEQTELNFDKLRIKMFNSLKNYINKLDTSNFEWQESPFYKNYLLQNNQSVEQRLANFNDVIFSTSFEAPDMRNQRISCSGPTNLPGVDIRMSHFTKAEFEQAEKIKTQNSILKEIINQIHNGQRETTAIIKEKRSRSFSPSQNECNSIREHPIHMIVRQFSKYMVQVYKPLISKFVLTLWNNDPDEKFLNVLASLERSASVRDPSFFAQNTVFSEPNVQNSIRKTIYLSENGNQMLHELNEKFKHFHLYLSDKNLAQDSEFYIILQSKAQEDVSQFLETSLMVTAYFYRKSINIGVESFASKIAEALTEILFQVNEGGVFQIFLELYRLKHLDDIKHLKYQFRLYKQVKVTDFNTSLYTQEVEKEEVKTQKQDKLQNLDQLKPIESVKIQQSSRKGSSQTNMSRVKSECNQIFSFNPQVEMMKKMYTCDGPKEVLKHFLQIYKSIGNQFQKYMDYKKKHEGFITSDQSRKNQVMEADDFLAFLILIIIKSEFTDIIPLIEIIDAFTLNKRQKKFDYMKASLEGSIQFILTEIGKHIQLNQEPSFEIRSDNEMMVREPEQVKNNSDQSIKSLVNLKQGNSSKKSFISDAVNMFVSVHRESRTSFQIEKSTPI